MEPPLTLERAQTLLAEIVAEKGPDFKYVNPADSENADPGTFSCLYVHGDEPGCIVGVVLHRAGVPLTSLANHENETPFRLPHQWFENHDVKSYLYRVQTQQDCGKTWAEAVAAGNEYLERNK